MLEQINSFWGIKSDHQIADEFTGFKHTQTIKMMLNTRPGVGNDKLAGREKWEGVYVFQHKM